jgi:hypothetical protein
VFTMTGAGMLANIARQCPPRPAKERPAPA